MAYRVRRRQGWHLGGCCCCCCYYWLDAAGGRAYSTARRTDPAADSEFQATGSRRRPGTPRGPSHEHNCPGSPACHLHAHNRDHHTLQPIHTARPTSCGASGTSLNSTEAVFLARMSLTSHEEIRRVRRESHHDPREDLREDVTRMLRGKWSRGIWAIICYMKSWRNPENRKYATYAEEDHRQHV